VVRIVYVCNIFWTLNPLQLLPVEHTEEILGETSQNQKEDKRASPLGLGAPGMLGLTGVPLSDSL